MTDLGASSDIISNATYGPAGQLLTMTAGFTQGINETRSYNSIGQLTNISSCVFSYGTCTATLNAQYNYSATQNNGKITSQYDALSGETVAYLYDSLNRLASASGSGWGQSYTYDGFGNLTNQTVTSGTAPALSTTYDPTTNRQTGECADANGNLNSPICGGAYIYDIANRIVEQNPTGGSQPTVAYSYKPGNKRIWKGTGYAYNGQSTLPANEELTFWSTTGQKLGTFSLTQYQPGGPNTLPQLVAAQTATNYYFGGRLIKNTTGYVTPDRLGSIGKYFPFGQERPSATTNGKEKFATYFRDSETGLDYADQRYHQVGMGRFMTPDSAQSAHSKNPGSWNRYAYASGDPVNGNDPTGRDTCLVEQPFADPTYEPCHPDVDWCFMWQSMGQTMDPEMYASMCNTTGFEPSPEPEPDPGGGGGGGGDPQNPNCAQANPTVIGFLKSNAAAAESLSGLSGIPANYLLAWAGVESGNGQDPVAGLNQNFFGLTLAPGGVTSGWIGAVACDEVDWPGHACFSGEDGFYASGYAALYSNQNRNFLRLTAALAAPGATVQSVFDAIASGAPNMQFNANPAYGSTIQHYYDTSIVPYIGCF